MAKNLNSTLIVLMNDAAIRSNPGLLSIITRIKAQTVNDAETAYLLGLFFKYQFHSDNLPAEVKKQLIEAIKFNNVTEEYYLRKTAVDRDIAFFTIVFLIV